MPSKLTGLGVKYERSGGPARERATGDQLRGPVTVEIEATEEASDVSAGGAPEERVVAPAGFDATGGDEDRGGLTDEVGGTLEELIRGLVIFESLIAPKHGPVHVMAVGRHLNDAGAKQRMELERLRERATYTRNLSFCLCQGEVAFRHHV